MFRSFAVSQLVPLGSDRHQHASWGRACKTCFLVLEMFAKQASYFGRLYKFPAVASKVGTPSHALHDASEISLTTIPSQ
jgi:hypothetical protein